MNGDSLTSPAWETLRVLPLHVERLELQPVSLRTGAGWTRQTTIVRLHGDGAVGEGEDVTYQAEDHEDFRLMRGELQVDGSHDLLSFSALLEAQELWPSAPQDPASRDYRRWAFESAALDLALQQAGHAGRTLRQELDPWLPARAPQPVRFVLSLGLASPGARERFRDLLEERPTARFKLDYDAGWTPDLVAELAETGRVDVVDLKGHYRGVFAGPPADAEQYRMVAEGLPQVWIEDPEWNGETAAALEPFQDRISWDAPLHALADLEDLSFAPRCINVKPSRFGTMQALFAVLEHCRAHEIATYGGGQFELGIGRAQIQRLAALFHPDAPNDVAPAGYHAEEPDPRLPSRSLDLREGVSGFR